MKSKIAEILRCTKRAGFSISKNNAGSIGLGYCHPEKDCILPSCEPVLPANLFKGMNV